MKAMPYIVKYIKITAYCNKSQNKNCTYFFSYSDFGGKYKYSEKNYCKHTTGKVRQSLFCWRFTVCKHICKYISPFFIKCWIFREWIFSTVCKFQSEICRKKYKSSQCNSYNWWTCCNPEFIKAVLNAFTTAYCHNCKCNYCEKTGKISDIIIWYERQCKWYCEKFPFSLTADCSNSCHNKREKCYCIKPHDIPVISERITAKCKKYSESCNWNILSAECIPQKITEKSPCKAYFKYKYECKGISCIFITEKYRNPVKRTHCIIWYERKEIRTHTVFPRIKERTSGKKFFPQYSEKGIILMPEVNNKYLLISERVYTALGKCNCHYSSGNYKRQCRKNKYFP